VRVREPETTKPRIRVEYISHIRSHKRVDKSSSVRSSHLCRPSRRQQGEICGHIVCGAHGPAPRLGGPRGIRLAQVGAGVGADGEDGEGGAED